MKSLTDYNFHLGNRQQKKVLIRNPFSYKWRYLAYRIGVGSPEKLAAAHFNDDRRPDTHKPAGFRPIADKPSFGDPPCKIPKGSLPRSCRPNARKG